MSDTTDKEDRTEAATPRRLAQARDEGNVAISRELPALAGLGTLALVIAMAGTPLATVTAERLADLVPLAAQWQATGGLPVAITRAGRVVLLAAAPIAVAAPLAAAITLWLQAGITPRPAALVPDFARLSPRRGLRRMFGVTTQIELLKNLLRLTVLGVIAWRAFAYDIPAMAGAPLWTAPVLAGRMRHALLRLLLAMLAAQAVIATLDTLWVRARHAAALRMTRAELRQDMRESEGSPEVKQRLRQLRTTRARRRMMAAVKRAAVVVTNPTHYAVALAYERGQSAAPTVVAKGIDELAWRIREEARAHRVPLVSNPPLARALHSVPLDAEIPPAHFKAVAEIIAYVWRLRARRPGMP